jgi:hypothetical protein
VGEATMVNGSPWGQGSYGIAPWNLLRREDTAPTKTKAIHPTPVGAHSVGEATMVNGSPWGQGSYGIAPWNLLRRGDTAPTGSHPRNPFAVGTRLLRNHALHLRAGFTPRQHQNHRP